MKITLSIHFHRSALIEKSYVLKQKVGGFPIGGDIKCLVLKIIKEDKLVRGQTMLDRWNLYNDKLGVPPIHNEFSQLGKQNTIQSGCYECKSMKLIRDYEKGEITCGDCGLVTLEIMTVPKSPNMDLKSDQWDGLMDSIEQILEKRISI